MKVTADIYHPHKRRKLLSALHRESYETQLGTLKNYQEVPGIKLKPKTLITLLYLSQLCQHVDFVSKVDKVVSQNHTTPLIKNFFLNFILCVLTTCCFCVEGFSLAPGASW